MFLANLPGGGDDEFGFGSGFGSASRIPPGSSTDKRPPEPEAAEALPDEDEWDGEDGEFDKLTHMLTHLPKNRTCPICVQAKLYEAPHRRRENQSEAIRHARDVEEAKEFLERVACDHIVARNGPGMKGEQYTFVIRDRYSGLIGVYPCRTKGSDEVEEALRRFCGRSRPGIVNVSSDRAPEILSALKRLGFCSEPSAPHDPVHNPFAESFIRTLKSMTSSILLQAGLAHQFWPLAQRYLEWAYPITASAPGEGSVTCFERAHGYPFEGFKVPFAALVWIKTLDPLPYQPKGEGALFLGAELIDALKFKGLYRTWPLSAFRDKVFKERVVRTLAVPPGSWQFPAKIGYVDSLKPQDQPGYLGEASGMTKLDDFENMLDSIQSDMDKRLQEVEDERAGEGETGLALRAGGGSGPGTIESETGKGETGLALRAGGGSGPEGLESAEKTRNRTITKVRVAVHGPTKGCHACRSETNDHTPICRERFNKLLDRLEPLHEADSGKGSSSKAPIAEEPKESFSYEPPGELAEEGFVDDLEDPTDVAGLINIASGDQIRKSSAGLERGSEVVAAILMEAIEQGENEEELSRQFSSICKEVTSVSKTKTKPQVEWFVEFCCSSTSPCSTVSQQLHVPYLGLSSDFGDLLNDDVFEQVMYWFHERVQENEAIHLFGSIPHGPFKLLQYSNVAVQSKSSRTQLGEERAKSLELVERFKKLSRVALASGGTSSFEWNKNSHGWKEPVVLGMISEFNMYSSYPTGCGFDLTIKGLKPLKQWRVVSTSSRLSSELDKYRCIHEVGHKHDCVEEATIALVSGLYNLKMASVIVSSLCTSTIMCQVPEMPTVRGVIAHQEQGLWMSQIVLALVHKPLSREEMVTNPKAKEALMSEARQMRDLKVWDETTLIEVDELLEKAKKTGETIHISEIMPICHVKGAELSPDMQKLKGRLVFRGDACRDEKGNKAIFREVKSLPATVHSINIVLYFGLQANHKVEIGDATKAYLQAPLRSNVPTWVIIPRIIWLDGWAQRFKRVAARLDRAMYGHTTSGDDWHEFFDDVMVAKLAGRRVEEYPSLWYFDQLEVLVAAYVDDVIAAGPCKGVDDFWVQVRRLVTFDEVSEPGRYLGREHMVVDLGKGRAVYMSMADYAKSAVEMYEGEFGPLKCHDTPYVSESLLSSEGFEEKGHLAGNAASLLMKLLWLARLSRPDLSFGIVSLAGAISRWSRNHDVMLKRLLGYVKNTFEMGLWGVVSHQTAIPKLKLYCDADLAGDHLTCKSHSGIFVVIETEDGEIFPISWTSKRQSAVARSTTEAELASANECVFSDGIPIKTVLELLWKHPVDTLLMEDNSSCITILQAGYSPKLRSMSRTHRISVAALSEAITAKLIALTHTSTKDQLADLLTKALNRPLFLQLRCRIGISNPPNVLKSG